VRRYAVPARAATSIAGIRLESPPWAATLANPFADTGLTTLRHFDAVADCLVSKIHTVLRDG
jgi:hypothetical protein